RLVAGYDYGDGDSNPMDDSSQKGHGTACAGVAAARANNGFGVAGAAGGCSVMPLKVANSAGDMYFTAIENAITHAADNGAHIISLSLGAATAEGGIPSTDAVLEYAYAAGVTIFAATANGNTNTITYPANHNKVISVGAASPTGERKSTTSSDGEYWWGSNYGSSTQDAKEAVDIMGPTILPTTDISGSAGYSTTDYYMWFNGTSCATPYVAGVAALVKSKDPSLTPAQLRTALVNSTTDMTIDGGVGWDRYTGYGLVNGDAALFSLTPGLPTCLITSPAMGTVLDLGSMVEITVSATDSDGYITKVEFFLDYAATPSFTDYSAPYSWTWDTTGATGGSHSIKAVATDNDLNTTQNQLSIILNPPPDEGFESGDFSAFNWVNDSIIPWTVHSGSTFSGSYGARSGDIGNGATSTLSLSLEISAAGNITFYRKVSSESGFDYLRFYIDEVEQESWSGESVWTFQSYPVSAGFRSFRWTYSKDGSVAIGSDCAWLDHIVFPLFLGDLDIPFAEGFEDGWNGWKAINGTQTNKWQTGTATAKTGTKAAYISNDGGTTNAYTVGSTSVVHLQRKIVFPSSTESFKLRFAWKGNGQTTLDGMKVYLVDTSVTPIAGTQLGSGQIGTLYNQSGSWQETTIDLGTAPSSQTKRLVFSWFNDNSSGTQPPIAVDDIRIVIGSQSDAAVVIDASVTIDPPPVNDPEANPISTQIIVTGLSDLAEFIVVNTSYAPPEISLPDAGLCLSFYGAAFAGTTISITHDLGFVPNRIAYRLGTGGGWIQVENGGGWTNSNVSFTIPAAKADEDLIIVFPDSQDGTLPVTLSSFNAVISHQNYVRLDWVTQTESGALGYYLHRHESDQLGSAMIVSPLIVATNTSQQQSYSFTDSETENGTLYYYWLQSLDMDGWTQYYGPIHISTPESGNGTPNIPLVTEVKQAYPNPFNPVTTIDYSIHRPCRITLEVYNIRGQIIRSYEAEHTSPGHYKYVFDGRDSGGRALASGVYYYRFRGGDYSAVRKMLISK
ncbi:MAG: S8 family serine peptidase, partial [Candidatus Cloacimonadaceae bacterium]|nr:S8 family serine peptidase [Candidatus Cloacimonadaceae bacterium]